LCFAVFRVEANAIARRFRSQLPSARKESFEETFGPNFVHRNRLGMVANDKFCVESARLEKAHQPAWALRPLDRLRTKDGKRIGVARRQQGVDSAAKLVFQADAGL